MEQRPRIYYTEEQKSLMWDRWQKGESLNEIACLFNRHHPSIQRILSETGGNTSNSAPTQYHCLISSTRFDPNVDVGV